MSQISPKVSIIMNCYNGERYLKEAIDSIYNQDFSNWEIIFWDNQSTDNSGNIAKGYDKRLKYFLANKHTTLGGARNLAIKQASGKYVAFLDCDDVCLPGRLSNQVLFMENSQFVLSYGAARVINEQGGLMYIQRPAHKSGKILLSLLYKHDINTQSVMIKKDVFEEDWCIFNSNFHCCADYNLYMHIASHYSIGVMSDILSIYRKHGGSLSRRTFHHVANELRLTIDQLKKSTSNQHIGRKLHLALNYLQDKTNYYEAFGYYSDRYYAEALQTMRGIRFKNLKYFAFFMMINLRLPYSLALRLMRR